VERAWREEKKKQGWKDIPMTQTRRLSVKEVSAWAWGIANALLRTRGENGEVILFYFAYNLTRGERIDKLEAIDSD